MKTKEKEEEIMATACRHCGVDKFHESQWALPNLCMYCWDGHARGTCGSNWQVSDHKYKKDERKRIRR